MNRIAQVNISDRWGMRLVSVVIDGTTKDLFTYYPDELSFTSRELIGLTEQEARALRHAKDVEYLQS